MNISGACRFVIMSVLLGGEGVDKAGRSLRSIDKFDRLRLLEAGEGGEVITAAAAICVAMKKTAER